MNFAPDHSKNPNPCHIFIVHVLTMTILDDDDNNYDVRYITTLLLVLY